MDQARIPIHHEAKKGYFVALRDAFFVWNPNKLKELLGKKNEGTRILG
jgi:hypothetical protein